MSAATVAPSTEIGKHLLERGDTVLWTLTGHGVILHNFASHLFLELDEVGYRTWGYLDGARPVDEVISCVAAGGSDSPSDRREVGALIAVLLEHGFVQQRHSDA
jgi:hypothetical protein